MKRTYVEVTCDECGQADHYKPPQVDEKAKANGWIVEGGKHFCDDDCRQLFNLSKGKVK